MNIHDEIKKVLDKYGIKKRPTVSQRIIDIFSDVVDSQDQKGLIKYKGKSIDDANDEDYNWNFMALEESVDLNKYLLKENIRLVRENEELKQMVKNNER